MVDDATRREEFEPDDEVDADADDRDEPVVVLKPALDRVSGGRVFGIALILGGGVAIGALIYGFLLLNPNASLTRGFEGVIMLVAGFVTVALLLYLGTLVLRALDMGAPGEALGMPEGSIRALIAMTLILIFAIIGIQVFTAGSAGEPVVSTGVTQAQIDSLRADGAQVIQQTLQTPLPSPPAAPLYTITTRTAMSQESHDFGLQLMTTVSTLVVAVAGFYFGSRAVSQASTGVQEQLKQTRQYSRRGNLNGPRPDPNAPIQETPAEGVGDEIGSSEEPEAPLDDAVTTADAAEPVTGEDTTEESGALNDGDEGMSLTEGGDFEPDAPADDENGEPPAKEPPLPQG
jgi:hypothetical protein